MKQIFTICGVAAAGLMLTHTDIGAQAAGGMSHDHAAMNMAPAGEVTALLTSPMGSRSASGTATVTGSIITVSWTGDQAGNRRAWSVRRGTCAQDDGVVGLSSAYQMLVVDASGGATSSAPLSATPDATHPLHVVVQYAAPASGVTPVMLACGQLWDGALQTRPAARSMPAMPAMDHTTMDHSKMAMPMDDKKDASKAMSTTMNKTMDMSAVSGHDMHTMHEMAMPELRDSSAASLMAIYRHLLADPVIRERVAKDTILQQLLERKPTAKKRSPVSKTPVKPTPATKPAMDHSKMPGMKKPPA